MASAVTEICDFAARCGWEITWKDTGGSRDSIFCKKGGREIRADFSTRGSVTWTGERDAGSYHFRDLGGREKRRAFLDILAGPQTGTVRVHEVTFLQGDEADRLVNVAARVEGHVVHGPTRESTRRALAMAQEYLHGEATEDMVFCPEGHEMELGRDTAREGDLVIQWTVSQGLFGIYLIAEEGS